MFDNADRINLLEPFWPASSVGHILLTSRNPAASRGRVQKGYELPRMSSGEAVNLFLNQLSHGGHPVDTKDELETIEKITVALGCLPLAVVQVAAFTLATGSELSTTLQFLEDRRTQTELLLSDDFCHDGFYGIPAGAAWDLSISALTEDSKDLLSLLCFLDPDSIPTTLLRERVQQATFEFGNVVGPGLR